MRRGTFDQFKSPLLPVSKVIEYTKIRSDGYTNLYADKVSDIGIHWCNSDSKHSENGWYAKIDGRDMLLSAQGLRGASKLVMINDIRYWDQFHDKDAFPKQLKHILEQPSTNGLRADAQKLLVRHDGIKIRAILPDTYVIKDAHVLIKEFTDMLSGVGPIKGVNIVEGGADRGDLCSYRVVMDTNIIPELAAEYGQHILFVMSCSETGGNVMGGATSATVLGLFRTICTNSSVHAPLLNKWNNNIEGLEKFFQLTGKRIEQITYYQDNLGRIMSDMARAQLVLPVDEILSMMSTKRLITGAHSQAAGFLSMNKTEDGRAIETQYDLFNLLTNAAQDLPFHARQNAEATTMELFTGKGGFLKHFGV